MNHTDTMPSPTADPVIPLRRAAVRCGVSPDTLRRRGSDGSLQILRLGPRLLGVRTSELERWLATCAVQAAESPLPTLGRTLIGDARPK